MKTIWNLALMATLVVVAFTTEAAPRRNVILFVVDDQSQDAGCYGNKVIKTPNLDRLAAGGTRFNNSFCTTASCSASRSVILTGLHNHANGQYGHQHSYHNFHTFEWIRSLPVLLGEAGYRTARIGKFHVQPEETYKFQTVLGGNQGGSRNPVTMAEKCRDLIAAKDEKPFFLYFCTSDPHRGGGKLKDVPHGPDAFGNNQKYEGVTEVIYDPKDVIVPPWLPDTPECRAEIAQYYQSISRIDQGVGRLVQILKETGQYENTMIIYTADNGMAFPGSKTTLYEPGMKLPLIVRSPDQKKRGVVCNGLVSWVDLTPTILDVAGVKEVTFNPPSADEERAVRRTQQRIPYTFHGRSFLSILDQENPKGWDEVYGSHTFHEITMYYPMRLIRTPKYKLLYNVAHQLPFPFASDLFSSITWQSVIEKGSSTYGERRLADFISRPQYELYDLEYDPFEARNLAHDPTHAKVLAELQGKLKAFQEKTKDPWVVKYRYE